MKWLALLALSFLAVACGTSSADPEPDVDCCMMHDALPEDVSAPGDAVDSGPSDTEGDTAPPPAPLYTNDGTHLRDAAGRALILRGVNYPSDDVAYWADQPVDADLADFRFLAASGFNAIRLVINWDRLEPEPDALDFDYIALVARHARLASESGLYVIVDLHQDLFGLGFNLHGAPRWACDEALYASFEPVEPWFSNYFSPEVSACFTRFWKDPELQAHHHRAARALAETLADVDRVLGFDPWNEPFPGTLSHEVFERDHLWPFYRMFFDLVDDAMPGRLLFFEPSVLISVYKQTTFPTPEGPDPLQAVFFPHYYNFSVETTKHWDGVVANDQAWVDAAAGEAARLGVPWGIGELGGAMETPNLDAFLYALYDLLDQAQAGAFLWIFTKGTGGFGLVDATTGQWVSHARAFLRPAPSVVAGTPLAFGWDPVEGVFELAWEEDPEAGDTELLIPAWLETVGFTLQVDGVEQVSAPRTAEGRLVLTGGKGGAREARVTALGPYPD